MPEKESVANRLLDMFAESVILQSLITVGLLAASIYTWVNPNIDPPEQLTYITTTVVGFWFGQKIQVGSKRSAGRLLQASALALEDSAKKFREGLNGTEEEGTGQEQD